jgi:hypothetical protein
LRALCVFDDQPEHDMLVRALHDHLGLLRKRIVAFLAVRYGAASMAKVEFQLVQRDARSRALAIEWMEVTFVGADRDAIALIEPGLPAVERLRLLTRGLGGPALPPTAILHDLVADPRDMWRSSWLSACALATALNGGGDLDPSGLGLDRAPWVEAANAGSSVLREMLSGVPRRLQI